MTNEKNKMKPHLLSTDLQKHTNTLQKEKKKKIKKVDTLSHYIYIYFYITVQREGEMVRAGGETAQ